MTMSDEDGFNGPMKARSDLVDMLRSCPDNTAAIVTLIQSELKDIQDREVVSSISNALDTVASDSGTTVEVKNNVLYWLTETSLDARQMIMVRTIEELLGIKECKSATLEALSQISSEENVEMVMAWVEKKILTLNQAVYVLLFPESSEALR